jgi:hypothetical protein
MGRRIETNRNESQKRKVIMMKERSSRARVMKRQDGEVELRVILENPLNLPLMS